jgi:hypothetical protein
VVHRLPWPEHDCKRDGTSEGEAKQQPHEWIAITKTDNCSWPCIGSCMLVFLWRGLQDKLRASRVEGAHRFVASLAAAGEDKVFASSMDCELVSNREREYKSWSRQRRKHTLET